jgi:hypothetical protein
MSPSAILKDATGRGVSVTSTGDKLVLRSREKPPDDLLNRLRQHKAEIIALLRQDCPEPELADIEERKGMAMGSVPEPYLDAWARVQLQKPLRVSDDEWSRAVDDAGRFLDQWGSLAVEYGWTPGDLFDVPHDGRMGGVAWFIGGETVRVLGPRRAVTDSGREFTRRPHRDIAAVAECAS